MAGHRITHIRRPPSDKRCQAITHVKMDGKSTPVEQIIKMMQGRGRDHIIHTFYIDAQGVRVSLKLAPNEEEATYIRTERDDSPYDNLLMLPRF